MRLFLVQHGDAVPEDIDPDRPLSDRGRSDIKRLAEWLVSHHIEVEQILHSGKTRARQTAEGMRPLVKDESQISARAGLAPNDPPAPFLQRLQEDSRDTLVAGHMPFVARAVSLALTGAPDHALIDFLPGSVAGLKQRDDASWQLFLFARPEILKRIGLSQAVY